MSYADLTEDAVTDQFSTDCRGKLITYNQERFNAIFRLNGDDIPARVGNTDNRADLAVLLVLKSDIPDPKKNDQVTLDSVEWKVISKHGKQSPHYHRLLIGCDRRRVI